MLGDVRVAKWKESATVPERSRACPAPVTRLIGARLAAPRLAEALRFARDFGLILSHQEPRRLHLRAAAPLDPALLIEQGPAELLGLSFLAARERDIAALARLADARGTESAFGNPALALRSPDGIEIAVVANPQHVEALEVAPELPRNTTRTHGRRNEPIRMRNDAARVYRLHSVELGVQDVSRSARWYQDYLGLRASEMLFLPDEEHEPAAVYLRADCGRKPVDHHCLALYRTPRPMVISMNFECEHLDDLAMGGEFLTMRGWKRLWGVVRRRAGSALYSCYNGPAGLRFAHVCDGDRVNGRYTTGYSALTAADALQLWGPRPPRMFFGADTGTLQLSRRAMDPAEPLRLKNLLALRRAFAGASDERRRPRASG